MAAAGTFEIAAAVVDLTNLIMKEDKDLQVISVCGTGGDAGKLSVIRMVYDDQSRTNTGFEYYAWVKLMHPFCLHDFLKNMVAQLCANKGNANAHGQNDLSADALRMRGVFPLCDHPMARWAPARQGGRASLRKAPSAGWAWFLRAIRSYIYGQEEKRKETSVHVSKVEATSAPQLTTDLDRILCLDKYLVVLEDVASMPVWDTIKAFLPNRKNGSQVIVSTHQLEIASLLIGNPYQVSELG
ncbi:hypothetical protein HU200_034630 [Digitaria exilis]|uniref:NB-ARC domain-containing protein n=1 Tax=Digitaria exilis TaxID=1010633 RepID=A0A835ENU2_9POAL|nr:hypothetical protein HU200_034630 [Digitaria exilis]